MIDSDYTMFSALPHQDSIYIRRWRSVYQYLYSVAILCSITIYIIFTCDGEQYRWLWPMELYTLVSIELSNRWIHFKSHIVIHAGMQQQKTAFYINSYWYKNLKVLFYYKSTLNSPTPLDCAQFMFYDTWLPPLYLCIIIVCGFFKDSVAENMVVQYKVYYCVHVFLSTKKTMCCYVYCYLLSTIFMLQNIQT